ncbi:BTAD domain-containing putative transcriptional regulator [Actinoplanes sp. N902-109]|uniref:BTAD domain-containing putative transcriptional regulator n=1 Tax=Actinoplanes sp. (strain N902-109) TaxID=649831 RepID=UPI0003293827|nr:BTAD domain-containing putative transcriptional regulator [Actinoplanes sp. N902-109]AGL16419.1 SARP family transcriptional regulator [Actinoplanes sp. N902-109]
MAELRLLGPVEIWADGGPVRVGEPRRLAVLAALGVDTGRVVPTATLIDRVWGDAPPGQATRTLGTYITRIRRVLEESFRDSAVTVVNQPGGYRLTAEHEQVDLFRFRELVAQARMPSCTAAQRVDLLRRAVSLHRGDPLTGVDGAWAARTREQLAGELLTVMAEWAEAELAVGNATAVLPELTALADANPLVEPLVVALVRALAAAGRPTEALERCRLHGQRLAEEYGTDPSPQMTQLYAEILRADHQPVAAPSAPAAPPVEIAEAPAARPVEVAEAPAARPVEVAEAPAMPPVEVAEAPARMRKWRRSSYAAAVVLLLVFGAIVYFRSADPPANGQFSVTEEFSGNQLPPGQWFAHETQGENGSAWSPSNVRVNDGELQIIGTGRSPTGRGNMAGSVCWCNEGGIVRAYGVWKVRAKFDVGAGYAPVVGLYPDAEPGTPGWGFLTMARLDGGDRRTVYPVIGGGDRTVNGTPVTGDFTAWNTFAIEWRPDFVTVSLNDTVILDTRKAAGHIAIPTVPMFLYAQIIAGPDGPVPAPNRDTPDQVTMHVDWVRYSS